MDNDNPTFTNQRDLDRLIFIMSGSPRGIPYMFILDPFLSQITGEAHISPDNLMKYIKRKFGVDIMNRDDISLSDFIVKKYGSKCADLVEKML